MAPTAAIVNDLLSNLEEDDFNAAIRYIQFLSSSRRQERTEQSKRALQEIQDMFLDGNTGWNPQRQNASEDFWVWGQYYKLLLRLIYSETASLDIFQMRPIRKAFISPDFSRE